MLAFAGMPPKTAGAKPPKRQHAPDPPPVANDVPSPELQEIVDLARFGKRFGRLVVGLVTGFGGAIVGCAIYLVVLTHSIDTRLAKLETRVDDHIHNHNGVWSHGEKVGPAPDQPPSDEPTPGPKQLPSSMLNPDLSKPPKPPASATPEPPESASSAPPAMTADHPRSIPNNLPFTSPPECVHRGTMRKFPCEQARESTCLGLRGLTPQRYAEIRKKSGAGEYMLVCDAKSDPTPTAGR